MDLWVALAAAGAGYVAKHWKNFEKENQNSSDFSIGDPKLVTPQSPTLPSHGIDKRFPFLRLARRERLEEDNSNQTDSKEDSSSMPFGHLKDESNRVTTEESELVDVKGESSGNLYSEPLLGEIRSQYDSKKNRSSLRSRQSKMWMKPLTSLYNECSAVDEYMLSCFPLPTRPLIITDGSRIIGSEGANSLNFQYGTRKNRVYKQGSIVENEFVDGVTSLAYNLSLEVPGKRNRKGKDLSGRISSSVAREEHLNSLAGSTNGALLFGLGVSVGLISSLLANKTEVDKLNTLLKQTENLVQDLQEELEMKDSLTVKEIPSEDFESHDKRAKQSFSSEQNLDGTTLNNGEPVPDQRENEDLESMGRIEAELEAELERLELNMNLSSLERRLSDLAEADPDFVPGVSQDELRPDMFGARIDNQPYADQDGSGSSTRHPANYAVSAQELTLRLHELIQTNLEERVKELETALEASERKARVTKSDHKIVPKDSDSESISSQVSINEPMVINLSGEALDAYNEVYDELKNANEYKKHDNVDGLPRVESTLDWQISSEDIGCSGTESESDDEFEKLLIKQIVEKNRRNSAAIRNVERELFRDKM